MLGLKRIPKTFAFLVCAVALSSNSAVWPQASPTSGSSYLPPEVQIQDPIIKPIVESAEKAAELGHDEESLTFLENALQLAIKQQSVSDAAIIEDYISVYYFLRGKLDDAKTYSLKSLSDATTASNLIVQADVMVRLAAFEQERGDLDQALKMTEQALEISRKSKNLYMQSRVLGELGRLRLLNHKPADARASIEEALAIDHANQFKWEPEHLYYLSMVAVIESNKDKAIELGTAARDLAINEDDYITFVQASQFLGQGFVFLGQVDKGIQLLELSRQGVSDQGKQLFQHPDQYSRAVALPYLKITYLEALGTAYDAAHKPDDAIRTWQELFENARAAGFKAAQGESALKVADLYKRKPDPNKSIEFYSLAAELFAASGDQTQAVVALRGEEIQLTQLGQKDRALEIEEKLLGLAKATNDTQSRFLQDLIIAELLDGSTQTDRAQAALEDADSLVDLSGAVTGTKPALLAELYSRLAVIYLRRQDTQKELIAIEKAIPSAISLGNAQGDQKNTKPLSTLVPLLEKRIAESNVRTTADTLYGEGRFQEALPYFEILRYFDETEAAWNNKYKDYIAALSSDPVDLKLSTIPSKVISQDNGAAFLANNVEAMGTVAESHRLQILGTIVAYYSQHQRPDLVVKYGKDTLPFLPAEKDTPTPFAVSMYCELASAFMQEKDLKGALEFDQPCLTGAKTLGDPNILYSAHLANWWILDAAGRHEEAEVSAQYLATRSSDDPTSFGRVALIESERGNTSGAVQAFRRAIEIYHSANNMKGEADARLALANLTTNTTAFTPDDRRADLEAADALYRSVGSGEGQVTAETYLALYGASDGNEGKSPDLFRGALKLARDMKKKDLEAFVVSKMALAAEAAHDLAHAADYFKEAAKLYHEQGDFADEALQMRGITDALMASHDLEGALQEILGARSTADRGSSYFSRYIVRTNLAWIYVFLGQFDDGISVLREAKQIADQGNLPVLSAIATLGIAQAESTVGNWEDAYDSVTAAIPVFERFNDPYNEYMAYSMLMEIYGSRESDRNDYAKALETYQKAQQVALKANLGQAVQANLDQALIEVFYTNGRFKDAIAKAEKAVDYFKRSNDDLDEANALLSLSEAERSDGDLQGAVNSLQLAKPLAEKTKDFYTIGRLRYGQAGLYRREGKLREAIEQFGIVIQMIEEFKTSSNAEEVRHVAESYGYIYDDLIETYYSLAQTDKTSVSQAAEKALEYTELNKARAFSISWGSAFIASLRRGVPGVLQEKESAINRDLVSLQSQLQGEAMAAGNRAAKHLNQRLEALKTAQSEFETQLRVVSPAYAEIRYPEHISVSQIPLRSGELLVELKMLKDSTLVWLIQGDEKGTSIAAFYRVNQPKTWFADRILKIRDAFNAGHPEQFDSTVTDELLAALFPESSLQLAEAAKSVIIVPDDLFFLFPFEMLSSEGRFIFLNKPMEYFPSAGALRLARTAIHSIANREEAFIGVADPITSADDPRYQAASLSGNSTQQNAGTDASSGTVDNIARRGYQLERIPATAAEVKGIVSLFSSPQARTKTLIGLDATKEQLLRTDLTQYDFIHFATHGILPVESGIKEPALVLSYDGQSKSDMLLTLSDILKLKLQAKLVVLSACNTGSGRVTKAEGVVSLGSAFLAAGSESVLMSLWDVSDTSTALLMKEYYKNLLSGKSKVESLAAAREEIVSKGYDNPFFWAPFILTGE